MVDISSFTPEETSRAAFVLATLAVIISISSWLQRIISQKAKSKKIRAKMVYADAFVLSKMQDGKEVSAGAFYTDGDGNACLSVLSAVDSGVVLCASEDTASIKLISEGRELAVLQTEVGATGLQIHDPSGVLRASFGINTYEGLPWSMSGIHLNDPSTKSFVALNVGPRPIPLTGKDDEIAPTIGTLFVHDDEGLKVPMMKVMAQEQEEE